MQVHDKYGWSVSHSNYMFCGQVYFGLQTQWSGLLRACFNLELRIASLGQKESGRKYIKIYFDRII